MSVWAGAEKKSVSSVREDTLFLYDWVYVLGQKNDCAATIGPPSRDHRRVVR